MEGLNFIDLFCGVGGFRQALSSLGLTCVFSSDLDKDARETYQTNYGELPVGDITKIEADAIPTHHVLCGGFPCQPFSISGKMNGFGDARGTLLYEILRIARVHKPKVLFLENVKNYQSHAGGRTMDTTLSLLEEAGYKPCYQVLNASGHGVPKREACFCLFSEDQKIIPFIFRSQQMGMWPWRIFYYRRRPCSMNCLLSRKILCLEIQGFIRVNKPIRIGTVGKEVRRTGIQSQRACDHLVCFWGRGRGKNWDVSDRRPYTQVHPRECARLMGFPEDSVLHERRNVCYKQFGNQWPSP